MLGRCPSGKDKNRRKTQEFKSLEGVDQSKCTYTTLQLSKGWWIQSNYTIGAASSQYTFSARARIAHQNIAENSVQEQKTFHYCINTTKSEEL